ncbi:MAG: hypothetical protein Q9167_001583 [Letrouitia subvulpina]
MDRIIHDANTEIDTLNQRISALQVDKDKLQSDNTSLVAAFRDKSRKHQQTQELYDRLKRKEMTAATQSAALESVDEALGNVTSRHGNKNTTPAQHRTQLGRPLQDTNQWYQQNQRGELGMMNGSTQNQTPFHRNSHGSLNANINKNMMNSGGTSSRVKAGRQQDQYLNRYTVLQYTMPSPKPPYLTNHISQTCKGKHARRTTRQNQKRRQQ